MTKLDLTQYHSWRLRAIEQFLKAVGYREIAQMPRARFVGVCWGAGDEAYHNNGLTMASGHFDAFLEYTDHVSLRPLIGGAVMAHTMRGGLADPAWLDRCWWLGSSEQEATHYLVFDRDLSIGYLIPSLTAAKFLRSQWGHAVEPPDDATMHKIQERLNYMITHWLARPLDAAEHSRRIAEANEYHVKAMRELHQALCHYTEIN